VQILEPVTVQLGAESHEGEVCDVSKKGLLLRLPSVNLAGDEQIGVNFVLSEVGKRVEAEGQVLRAIQKNGETLYAVRLDTFSGVSEKALSEFIDSHDTRAQTLSYYR